MWYALRSSVAVFVMTFSRRSTFVVPSLTYVVEYVYVVRHVFVTNWF